MPKKLGKFDSQVQHALVASVAELQADNRTFWMLHGQAAWVLPAESDLAKDLDFVGK